jgi:hypothetical protein
MTRRGGRNFAVPARQMKRSRIFPELISLLAEHPLPRIFEPIMR